MAKQHNAGSHASSREGPSAYAAARWKLSATGVAAALVAILIRLYDDDLARLFNADDTGAIEAVTQAMGLAAVALGLLGLLRREVDTVCGMAILLGVLAIFLELFVLLALAAIIVAIATTLRHRR